MRSPVGMLGAAGPELTHSQTRGAGGAGGQWPLRASVGLAPLMGQPCLAASLCGGSQGSVRAPSWQGAGLLHGSAGRLRSRYRNGGVVRFPCHAATGVMLLRSQVCNLAGAPSLHLRCVVGPPAYGPGCPIRVGVDPPDMACGRPASPQRMMSHYSCTGKNLDAVVRNGIPVGAHLVWTLSASFDAGARHCPVVAAVRRSRLPGLRLGTLRPTLAPPATA